MITITTRYSGRGTHITVTMPGTDARYFGDMAMAESYAEIRSLVLDLPVERKDVWS
jgi:hypothetical protein